MLLSCAPVGLRVQTRQQYYRDEGRNEYLLTLACHKQAVRESDPTQIYEGLSSVDDCGQTSGQLRVRLETHLSRQGRFNFTLVSTSPT